MHVLLKIPVLCVCVLTLTVLQFFLVYPSTLTTSTHFSIPAGREQRFAFTSDPGQTIIRWNIASLDAPFLNITLDQWNGAWNESRTVVGTDSAVNLMQGERVALFVECRKQMWTCEFGLELVEEPLMVLWEVDAKKRQIAERVQKGFTRLNLRWWRNFRRQMKLFMNAKPSAHAVIDLAAFIYHNLNVIAGYKMFFSARLKHIFNYRVEDPAFDTLPILSSLTGFALPLWFGSLAIFFVEFEWAYLIFFMIGTIFLIYGCRAYFSELRKRISQHWLVQRARGDDEDICSRLHRKFPLCRRFIFREFDHEAATTDDFRQELLDRLLTNAGRDPTYTMVVAHFRNAVATGRVNVNCEEREKDGILRLAAGRLMLAVMRNHLERPYPRRVAMDAAQQQQPEPLHNRKTIYEDSQNVHLTSVQSSVNRALETLLKLTSKTTPDANFLSDLTSAWTPTCTCARYYKATSLVTTWCNEKITYAASRITYKTLLSHVWTLIKDHPHKPDILNVLVEEIVRTEGVCGVGRFTGTLNALTGFVEDLGVGIGWEEEMQGRISQVVKRNEKLFEGDRKKMNLITREEVLRILKEYKDVTEEKRKEWIAPFDDDDEEEEEEEEWNW